MQRLYNVWDPQRHKFDMGNATVNLTRISLSHSLHSSCTWTQAQAGEGIAGIKTNYKKKFGSLYKAGNQIHSFSNSTPFRNICYQASMMEFFWNLAQKWQLSAQEAILLFVCTALAVTGLCTTAILNKKKNKRKRVDEEINPNPESERNDVDHCHVTKAQWSDHSSEGWAGPIKTALMSKVCWSEANKWEETRNEGSCNWRESVPSLLAVETMGYLQSRNKPVTPVWQRPILMGEKCELPRFSGLILYDEQGRSLRQSLEDERILPREKPTTVVTTLRDLL